MKLLGSILARLQRGWEATRKIGANYYIMKKTEAGRNARQRNIE
jgi:hypothetical protein